MPRTYRKSTEKRARQRALLERCAENYITGVLEELPVVKRRQLFASENRFPEYAQVNHIVYALLFHIVLHGKGRVAVAEYCNVSPMGIKYGLDQVDRALRRKTDSALKGRLLKVCDRFNIDISKLLLPDPPAARKRG